MIGSVGKVVSTTEPTMSSKTTEYEQHVFHSGTAKSYERFVEENAHRIVETELSLTGDRVIVYVRPERNAENVVFVAGHFFGGL